MRGSLRKAFSGLDMLLLGLGIIIGTGIYSVTGTQLNVSGCAQGTPRPAPPRLPPRLLGVQRIPTRRRPLTLLLPLQVWHRDCLHPELPAGRRRGGVLWGALHGAPPACPPGAGLGGESPCLPAPLLGLLLSLWVLGGTAGVPRLWWRLHLHHAHVWGAARLAHRQLPHTAVHLRARGGAWAKGGGGGGSWGLRHKRGMLGASAGAGPALMGCFGLPPPPPCRRGAASAPM